MFNANRAVWEWLKEQAKSHDDYPYSHPWQALRFDNSDHMVRSVDRSGSHYFSRDTMRVFKCRLYELVSGRFLIVSDMAPDGRIYRVAYATQPPEPSSMISMERSSHMATLDQARGFARELIRLQEACPDQDILLKRVVTAG